MSNKFKKTGITTTFKKVTPLMAAKFLKNNANHNRALSKPLVSYLANCIKRGEWKLTHQAIGFDVNGVLIDGQHRLSAVVMANQTVDFMVATGLDPKSYDVLDQGKMRNTADILNIPKTVAEPINFISSQVFKGIKVSPQQREEIYNLFGKSAHELVDYCKTKAKYFGSASFKSAAIFSMMKNPEDKGYVLDIYEKLNNRTFSELPLIAESLLKLILNGKADAGFDKNSAFNYGMKVFDKSYAKRKNLNCSPYADEVLKDLKDFYHEIK